MDDPIPLSALNQCGYCPAAAISFTLHVSDGQGEIRPASDWVPKNGRAKLLRRAQVTALKYEVAAIICVKKKGMKEAWCMVVSDPDVKPAGVINLYGKRWGIRSCGPANGASGIRSAESLQVPREIIPDQSPAMR